MQITFLQVALPALIVVLFLGGLVLKKKEGAPTPARRKPPNEEAFREAVLTGDLATVKKQLALGVDPCCVYPETGMLPVHIATIGQHAEVLKALIAAGAQASAPSPLGTFPIHYAAIKGNLDCLDVLLAAGANPDEVKASNERRPIHYAADQGHLEFIKRLLAAGAKGNLETVEMMIPPHLRTAPVSQETHPDVSLAEGLKQLEQCGLALRQAERAQAMQTIEECLVSEPSIASIAFEMGREDDHGPLSDDVFMLDMEEMETDDTYKKLLERFRDMAKGAFPLQNIQLAPVPPTADSPSWITFELHGIPHKWDFTTGWLDLKFMDRLTDLFDFLNTGKRFARISEDFGQCLVYVCVSPEQYEKLEFAECSMMWSADDKTTDEREGKG